MAGDWLKFEKATPDKPEVFAIAAALEINPDEVVGKLIRVWSWFDTHTTDGNGRGVTSPLLDRIAGVTGFVSAMQSVAWIEITPDGVRLPNFDRHTGETAKARGLTAKRVAKHKEKTNASGNASGVTTALPREEKRREAKAPPAAPADFKADLFARWKSLPNGGGGAFLNKLFKDHKPEQRVLEAVEQTLDHEPADPKAFVLGKLKKSSALDDAHDQLLRGVI